MKLPTRFRVRTWMALVALVALGFGVAFEVKNHAERDRLLKARIDPYRRASIHLMRALECKSFGDRQVPYRGAERMKLLSGDPTRGYLPGGPFRSWQEEIEWHMYWGGRLFDQTQSNADSFEALRADDGLARAGDSVDSLFFLIAAMTLDRVE